MSLDTIMQSIVIGLSIGGIYALLASGMTLIYATTKVINIAHGDLLALALYIAAMFSIYLGWDPYTSMAANVVLLSIVGIAVFKVFMKPLLKAKPVLTFQVLLGLVYVMENSFFLWFKADGYSAKSPIATEVVRFGSLVSPLPNVIAIAATLAVSGGFYLMLMKTDFGRAIRAIAVDREIASMMGVNVGRTTLLSCALAFGLVAVGASLIAPTTTVTPYQGLQFTLFGLIVLVVGGMGNFLGALVAGFLIGFLRALSALILGPTLALVVPFFFLLLIMIVRPRGLFKPL